MKTAQIPTHLNGFEATGLAVNEPIAQFEIGNMQNFIYLILDWKSRKAAIVDPQKDLSLPLNALKEHGFELTTIVLTHTHHDHIAGVVPLLAQMPNLEIKVGRDDTHRLPESVLKSAGLQILKDREEFQIGALHLLAMGTPGHSAGAYSYYMSAQDQVDRPYLFTGDTIFIRDCGRTDFDSGSNDEMFESIQKVKKLSLDTVFLVGHHYAKECATTLQNELFSSPPFQAASVEALAALP